jgi:hypothetical protein
MSRTDSLRVRLVVLVATILTAMLLVVTMGNAQEPAQQQPQFLVYADTAGISPVEGQPNVYVTWVFAKATPTSYPSSGVLVAWDCKVGMVKRLAQVVYQMHPDSLGVFGVPEEVDMPWVPITDPRLAQLVCRIGPEHAGTATHPWFAPGKPRADA